MALIGFHDYADYWALGSSTTDFMTFKICVSIADHFYHVTVGPVMTA